ncbi:hypothetical protein Skr01_58500 [Sphaerisporangium krabiense]|uniref:FtsX extracellular domain-containing protein n=1 Tax=Sphaerisporangium krabiense TaxID=763782 RepID=A0A7W8Z8D8_9ACTN|nr:permease-like cell division protein FtsX [Sphaerisporangium krabiense]MBB5629384.1 hypothetical protein [Sphaerisporangium krabiense]GII65765.1 hypothetical protein Skr01_58500 [Sphaerisporangium krabiense]
MDNHPDPPEPEELSFGEVSERGARLHAWILARRRALAVCVAATLVVCAAGAGSWYLRDLSRRPLPPPDGPWPERPEIMVALCHPRLPDCPAEGDAAAKDPAAVGAAVRAATGVTSIRFFDPGNVQEKDIWMPQLLERNNVRDTDVVYVRYLVGHLARREDYPRAAERARSILGVRDVLPGTPGFWPGKADVVIRLCPNEPGMDCTSVNDPPISEAQKQDIVDLLWDIEGVEKIYFEDRPHVAKVAAHYATDDTTPRGDPMVTREPLEEAFYVKLTDRRVIRTVGEAVQNMPGVRLVEALDPA